MTATTDAGGVHATTGRAAQAAAVAYVRSLAVVERPAALATIVRELAAADVHHRPEQVLTSVVSHGRLTVNFHPDRLGADGRTVAPPSPTTGCTAVSSSQGSPTAGSARTPAATGTAGSGGCSAGRTSGPA